jgi:putative mycofactocin binding protein MftB
MSKRYALHPLCQVRREAFGLLFYDLRGPRLLFAESDDLVEPADLEAGVWVGGATGSGNGGRDSSARLARLLSTLAEKGFLREQPVC